MFCSNCKKVCRKIYDPYCLTYEDGTEATFANKCVLDIEICLNGLNSKGERLVGRKGACDDEEYSYFPDNELKVKTSAKT
ncbi:hypothetical protein Bhyg_08066 [Pseudolycoriella hygida]|uniref:Kazal-like domain-containing protein n=1 Tax=Pseudolycoriella hygida TaxID=35572 RepID=A0A9Q0S4K0_9DIPT|nr:hypothetical protein Bhyg_08066 [Pseudolycoriella hygida]